MKYKGKEMTPFLFEVGKIVETKSGELKITSRYREKKQYDGYSQTNKMYGYKCLKCGYCDSASEGKLKRKSGCPVCAGQKCVKGINDLWTTDPEIASLLWNPEEGYSHLRRGKFYTDWKCPVCGKKIENINLAQITVERHVSCPTCSDSISYPNKFMFYLLEELGVEFQREFSPEWVGLKRYDFVIEDNKTIIEMDGGLGHGKKQWGKNKDISPAESLKTDKVKDILATENGYTVIRIDCRYDGNNRFQYIVNSICNSCLAQMYDLSPVDFKKIDSLSWKSNVAIACDLYNNSNLTVVEIAEKMKLYHETVREYLKQGAEYGICEYSVDDRRLPQSYYDSREGTRVLQYKKDGTFVACYESIHEASKRTGVNVSYITASCKGLKDSGKKSVWRYCKDIIDEQYIPMIPELFLLPINQYDKEGHYLRTFASLVEIHDENKDYSNAINRVVRVDHSIFYKGFLWKLEDGNHEDIESYRSIKGRPVVQIDPETEKAIRTFRSIREAEETLNINNIGAVLAGRRTLAGNCFWQYEDEYNSCSDKEKKLPQRYYDKKQKTSVLQYSKEGSFIAFYNSVFEASKSTGLDPNYIKLVCEGRKDSGKDYIWRYCKDYKDGQYIPMTPERFMLPINQYDKDGHYIKTFPSLIDIEKIFPDNTKIKSVVRVKHSVYSEGYQWKLDEGERKDIEPYIPQKGRAVVQLDQQTGEVINRFRSIKEAKETLGINNVGAVLAGKRNTCGGFCFKYEDEMDE